MNYAGDQSWKSYSSMPLGVDRERVSQKINQLDGDISISRDVALGLMFGDKTVYGGINDIDSRADFFGAMYQQTGAIWFKAAEDQSRDNLSGVRFDFAAGINNIFRGQDVMREWRSAAGNRIMENGFSNFVDIYSGSSLDGVAWSVKQLVNEQEDKVLQRVHEYYIPKMIWPTKVVMEIFGDVGDLLKPAERIKTGCKNMGLLSSCGDAAGR